MEQMVRRGVFRYEEVESWLDVCARNPSARKVGARMVLGIKNIERDPPYQKWKARLVALGDRILDAEGKRIIKKIPSSAI